MVLGSYVRASSSLGCRTRTIWDWTHGFIRCCSNRRLVHKGRSIYLYSHHGDLYTWILHLGFNKNLAETWFTMFASRAPSVVFFSQDWQRGVEAEEKLGTSQKLRSVDHPVVRDWWTRDFCGLCFFIDSTSLTKIGIRKFTGEFWDGTRSAWLSLSLYILVKF